MNPLLKVAIGSFAVAAAALVVLILLCMGVL